MAKNPPTPETATPEIIAKISEKAGSVFDHIINLVFLKEILQIDDDDKKPKPAKEETRKHRIALAQFRIFFKEDYAAANITLDAVFKIMKASDFQEFGFCILESILLSAKSLPAGEAMITEIIAEEVVGKDGKKAKKEKKVAIPNFHYKGNYKNIMALINEIVGQSNYNAQEVVRRLTEDGLISQSFLVKLARLSNKKHLKEHWKKSWQNIGDALDRLDDALLPAATDFADKTEGLKQTLLVEFKKTAAVTRQKLEERGAKCSR